MTTRRLPIALVAAILILSGCASPDSPGSATGDAAGGGSGASVAGDAPAADGEVLGQGTVLEVEGGGPELCFAVAESYPPQCSGYPVVGWDWEEAGGYERASGTTWGAYAVQGSWDGAQLTVTQPPISLALYDAAPTFDPRRDPATPGAGTPDDLARIQDELTSGSERGRVLGAYIENGYLFVGVVFDDGTIEAELDERFGPDLIVVEPQLREIR